MLKDPVLSQLSIGSRNVVSHTYVSSSDTSAVFTFSVLDDPSGLWPMVILGANVYAKYMFWVRCERI